MMVISLKMKDDAGKLRKAYVRSINMDDGVLEFTFDVDKAAIDLAWDMEMTLDWFRFHYIKKYPELSSAVIEEPLYVY